MPHKIYVNCGQSALNKLPLSQGCRRTEIMVYIIRDEKFVIHFTLNLSGNFF